MFVVLSCFVLLSCLVDVVDVNVSIVVNICNKIKLVMESEMDEIDEPLQQFANITAGILRHFAVKCNLQQLVEEIASRAMARTVFGDLWVLYFLKGDITEYHDRVSVELEFYASLVPDKQKMSRLCKVVLHWCRC